MEQILTNNVFINEKRLHSKLVISITKTCFL